MNKRRDPRAEESDYPPRTDTFEGAATPLRQAPPAPPRRAGQPPSRRPPPPPPPRNPSGTRPAATTGRTPPPPPPRRRSPEPMPAQAHLPPLGLGAPPPPTGIEAPRNAQLERDWRTPPAQLEALETGTLPTFELEGKSAPPPRMPSEPAPAPPAADLGGFDFELALHDRAEPAARPASAAPPPLAHAPEESFALDEPARPPPSARAPSDPGEPDGALAIGLDAPPPSSASFPHAAPQGDVLGAPHGAAPFGSQPTGQPFQQVQVPPAPSQAKLAAQAVLGSLPSGDEVKRFARNIAVASIGGKQRRVIKLEDPSTWIRPMAGPLVAFGLAMLVAILSVALTRGSESDVNLSWLYVPLLLGSIVFGVIRWVRLQD